MLHINISLSHTHSLYSAYKYTQFHILTLTLNHTLFPKSKPLNNFCTALKRNLLHSGKISSQNKADLIKKVDIID